MKNWITLSILLKANSSLFCMTPYVDTNYLNGYEKRQLRILRLALDACRHDSNHLDNFLPCKAPFRPLELAQSIRNFSPIAKELLKLESLNKKRTESLSGTIEGVDIKSVDQFENHRLRTLHFYLDACRHNSMHLNENMPFPICDLPLGISAISDKLLPITKKLLSMGARPNKFNHPIGGHAPIFKAIQHNAQKTIRYLIHQGALLFFTRKTGSTQKRIQYGNTIDGKALWSKDPKTFAFAEQEFVLRMLLLCRQKEGCIMQYAPKDVLKIIVSYIT